jgi:Core-2/I-Branching enzyme
MTRIAYIVSAYKLPAQLERLLRRLAAPGVTLAVHVDKKTRGAAWDEMMSRCRDLDVVWLPRHRSQWGGFGHVRATLKGIDHVVENGVPFDYAVLLTGQDYPLRPPAEIARVLGEAEGRSFMRNIELPWDPWGPRGGLDRVEDWHVITYRRLHVALPLRRKIPGGLKAWGGSAYWCLEGSLVHFVHGYLRENPDYVRFFEHVFVPDELFFQTIIMNSEHRHTVVNDDLRYVDWTREPAPAVLTRRDVPNLLESGQLFARKFDETVDSEVLDDLDRVDSVA